MNYFKNISRSKIKKRILISWLIIAVLSSLVGVLIGHIASYKLIEGKKNGKGINEAETKQIVIYGAYESMEAKTEIKEIDWNIPTGFEPFDVNLDKDLQEYIYCVSQAYNIDYSFVVAVIERESNYRPTVISSTNDYGLMQINKSVHSWVTEETGVTNYLDPYQNVIAGCFILHELFEKYDEASMVLMAYNMGEKNAKRLWDRGIYFSDYSRKVMEVQDRLNKEGK